MQPHRIRAAFLLSVVLNLAVGSSFPGDVPPLAGRRLVDVIGILRDRGLNVIYSTALVGEDVLVTVEPAGSTPRSILDEVLGSLGLAARDGPGGSVVVIRAAARDAGTIRGSDRSLNRREHIEEVVVTTGRHAIVQQEQAASTTVRDEDAVLVPTIGGDVSRVFALLPGVTGRDNSAAVRVRGSEAEDVSLILDGLELYEPYHLSGFQSPFSFIDNEIVDRIDVVGGGFTAERGDRHGGFVELSTSLPTDRRSVRLEAGTLNSGLSCATPVRLGSLLVSARGWYPEVFRSSIELGDTGLDPRFGDAYLKLAYHGSPRTAVSFHALAARDRLEYVESGGNERVDAVSGSLYGWVRVLSSWSPSLFSETVASGGRLSRKRKGVSEPEDVPFAVRDDRTVDFYGLKQDVSLQLGERGILKGGFEVRPLEADYRYETSGVDAPESVDLDPSGTSVAAWIAYRAALTDRLAVEAGLRWDRQTYTDDNQGSPRLNAVWRPGDRSEVRLSLGHFHQSQRIHELRIADGETTYRPAELSRQLGVTFQHRYRGGVRLRVDAYRRALTHVHPRYENLFNALELFPETEEDRVPVEPDRVRVEGLELLVGGGSGDRFHWWTSYAWSSAVDVIDDRKIPRDWDQTHAAKSLVAWRWGRGWTASLAGAIHTGWPTTPVHGEAIELPDGSIEIEPVFGERNSDRFPTYARLDLKVVRRIALPRSGLRLELDVVNVTDRKNVCCVDDVVQDLVPGGTVRTRRDYASWLGITPSFSAIWEF